MADPKHYSYDPYIARKLAKFKENDEKEEFSHFMPHSKHVYKCNICEKRLYCHGRFRRKELKSHNKSTIHKLLASNQRIEKK